MQTACCSESQLPDPPHVQLWADCRSRGSVRAAAAAGPDLRRPLVRFGLAGQGSKLELSNRACRTDWWLCKAATALHDRWPRSSLPTPATVLQSRIATLPPAPCAGGAHLRSLSSFLWAPPSQSSTSAACRSADGMPLLPCWLAVPQLHTPLPSERHERRICPFTRQFTKPANPPCLLALVCLCAYASLHACLPTYAPSHVDMSLLSACRAHQLFFQFTSLQARSVKCTDVYWVT